MKKKFTKLKDYSLHLVRILHNSKMPRVDLKNKNIKNLKVLLNKEKLLEALPKNAVVAEVGVDKGNFSEKIWNITHPKKLHLIDAWNTTRYYSGLKKLQKKFLNNIKENKIEIHVGLSIDIVDLFEDNYFDWIYLDTDHSYNTTKKELEKFSKKMKHNGIISGHDFVSGDWNQLLKYGVIEAVCEFCVNYGWEIIYLTMEQSTYPSFAIRKIKVG